MKNLWDFLAQNHKGTIHGTTKWWAVFAEGAGNEEQHRYTSRNRIHLSPRGWLKINFGSCHQKAVAPSERSEETSPAIGYKTIPQGCQNYCSLQNSSAPAQTHFPPLIFTQNPKELGMGESGPCVCTAGVVLLLADLRKMRRRNPKGQHAQEGICSGQLWSHVLQQSQPHQQAMPKLCTPGRKDEFTGILQNQGEAGNSGENVIIESNLLHSYAAVCTFQLIKPKDCSGGGGGEFHKLNPENIEGGRGGENSDSQRMFSSERCFSVLVTKIHSY